MSKQPTVKELESNLLDRYHRWKDIYDNGSTDPMYEDGTGLNLVRNHISYYKKQCEEVLGDKFFLYPDSYFYPLPIKVSHQFMSVDRVCGFTTEMKRSTKVLPYEEAVKFDWSEVLCQSLC